MQPGMLLCTLDIPSLFTNIPHNEGIQSIKEMLVIHKTPNSVPHNSYIIEILEVVLTNNHVEFNCKPYHQVSGTAVGTMLAPLYANLFMIRDDIFLIWPHGMVSLLKFLNHLNTVHSTIKFTSDISPQEISFLDLIIYIKGSKLYTRLYTKTTDWHVYLNFYSEHHMNLKSSIPYSQFLRLKRIYTEPQYLLEAQIHMYFSSFNVHYNI